MIPTFPGTNSEYDSAKAFREAGADAEILVFRNLTARHIEESLTALAAQIRQSQILMFPGGFSAGDEPDGSAKFIATIIRSPRVADAIMDLLKNRDGLILGICNGFQALIKTGLVPYGEIRDAHADAPTLVHNAIGRHISCYAHTRIVSTLSPWLANSEIGDIHPSRFPTAKANSTPAAAVIAELAASGQIATQYCDADGVPSMDIAHQSERFARRHRRHHQPLRPRLRQNGPHRTQRLAGRQKHPRQQTSTDLHRWNRAIFNEQFFAQNKQNMVILSRLLLIT